MSKLFFFLSHPAGLFCFSPKQNSILTEKILRESTFGDERKAELMQSEAYFYLKVSQEHTLLPSELSSIS